MPERGTRAPGSARGNHDAAAVHRTAPIDPVISGPTTDTSMIPVIRPSDVEPEEQDEGFLKNLTGSIAASWAAAGEDTYLEWEEYDTEAAARAAEEAAAEEVDSTRHAYTDDFSLADTREPPTLTSAVPMVDSETPGPSHPVALTGPITLPPITGPSSPIPQVDVGEPMRRRSVLRPSWLRPRIRPGGKASALLNRTVFDRRVNPQFVFNKIMQTERPKTEEQSIVDRLQGTPFQHTVQGDAHEGLDELETMSFVLDLGEALFRYGAGALEVETSIIAVTTAFGMKNTDADITNQSISLNWAPEAKIPYSRVRVVRSWSQNFQALSAVHRLVADVTSGRLTRSEAEAELKEITRQPKPYPRWLVTLSGAMFASLFASYLGAPILDAAAGFAATLLVMWTARQLTLWRVPEFFTLAGGGFAASAFAMIAFGLDADITPSMVTAGGLMILLPSVRIVGAIQDAINGFPMTAAGRLVSTMIAFAGMTSGIMAAVVGADLLGIVQTELAQGLTRLYPAPALILLVFFACSAAAIVEQTRPALILPTGAVGALGFCALYMGEVIGLGDRFTPVLGGFVVGALGRVVALRLGAPQLVVAVPAMMFMLPGLMVFRGMYQIAIENTAGSMMGGLFELFNALIIIMAIAAGIVLGDVVMRRFTSKLESNERSNSRRR
ncbi:threonine/serine ThrE exporter family protein [Nesterenkonia natronophila]|uniref:Threonine/serine exporter family protein n=1 Tax=Nesterenkonia natronophila TaxID=2174932 RepID=A0A3A4F088_9MICC|nr:threonine/serine exporter family protein [Nesterenkonia natronophila]RJN31543.1 threonine/serine exporter family protein [Nesterenkonia natronophila]